MTKENSKGANMDFISNNGASGIGGELQAKNLRPEAFRPYLATNKRGETGVYMDQFDAKTGKFRAVPLNVNSMQANSTLRRDEWKALDEAVLRIARERVTGINDLRTRNLTLPLANAMGHTVLEYHDMSDPLEAKMSMDGLTRGENARPEFGTNYLPLPIIHADYGINARVLSASRNMGNGIDVSLAEAAARRVVEKLENLLFTNTTYSFGNGTIYSYLNHPRRNTVTLEVQWTGSAITPELIKKDVLAMKQAMLDAKKYGPYVVYIPGNYETVLDEDYDKTTPGTTLRERLLKISGIEEIKVSDHLTDHNVIMVNMTTDTVRLVDGMAPTNVQWDSQGGMVTDYKVMAIQVPQIRADQNGNCGVVHLSA